MSRSSECPRCGTSKRRAHFACAPCWHSLPGEVKAKILTAYRAHGAFSTEWADAAAEAFKAWGMKEPRWLDGIRSLA